MKKSNQINLTPLLRISILAISILLFSFNTYAKQCLFVFQGKAFIITGVDCKFAASILGVPLYCEDLSEIKVKQISYNRFNENRVQIILKNGIKYELASDKAQIKFESLLKKRDKNALMAFKCQEGQISNERLKGLRSDNPKKLGK